MNRFVLHSNRTNRSTQPGLQPSDFTRDDGDDPVFQDTGSNVPLKVDVIDSLVNPTHHRLKTVAAPYDENQL